jgi:hypothetical protein
MTLAALALLATPTVVTAQPSRPAPPAPPQAISTIPPKVFLDAGYSHPDITPGMCQTLSVKEARCTIPGMTAGPYFIQASGTSTASGEGAVQAINILLGAATCNQAQSKNSGEGSKPWTSGPQTIRVACAVEILTDEPIVVRATYADKAATADPKGPSLSLRRMPWPGILQAAPAGAEADQPKADQPKAAQ